MPHRIFEKRHARPGTAPGTLRAPEQRVEQVRIRVIRYSPTSIEEVEVPGVEECAAFRPAEGEAAARVAWIDVTVAISSHTTSQAALLNSPRRHR